jgi:hypothetical protein
LGAAKDEQTAVEIVHRAIEGGVLPSTIAAGNITAAKIVIESRDLKGTEVLPSGIYAQIL